MLNETDDGDNVWPPLPAARLRAGGPDQFKRQHTSVARKPPEAGAGAVTELRPRSTGGEQLDGRCRGDLLP